MNPENETQLTQVTEIQTLATVEKDARLYAALARAQGKFPAIPRNKTVTVQTKAGRSYTFDYAPLETIFDIVMPILASEGLALTQPLIMGGDKTLLKTILVHEAGGSLVSMLDVPRGGTMQEFGSALTYLRRYCAQSILGIATEEDDDGNTAEGNTSTTKREPARSTAASQTVGEETPQSPGTTPQPDPAPSPTASLQERAERFMDSTDPKDIISMVENVDNVEQLQALMGAEATRKMRGKHARKTVTGALDRRLRELGAGGEREPDPAPSSPQDISEGGPTADEYAAGDDSLTPPAAQQEPVSPEASPSENGTVTAEKLKAAIAFVQDQPTAAEGTWTITSVLTGLATKHGVAESTLEAVPEDKLAIPWEALPDNVRDMIDLLGPESLSKLAATAK